MVVRYYINAAPTAADSACDALRMGGGLGRSCLTIGTPPLGREQGLDRVGDKILDADHGIKGGFAAA